METIFPEDSGFAGFFLVGARKLQNPSTGLPETEQTGTAIVKRTYDIQPSTVDPPTGTLAPASDPLPIFMQDQPEILVPNGDFEAELSDWQADAGVTIARVEDPADAGNHVLQVVGTANGRATLTFTFPRPVARRDFNFDFSAKADAATTFSDVQLKAGSHTACTITDPALTTTFKEFSAKGTWSSLAPGREVTVELRMADDAGRTVYYDNIAVQAITYEHDLAPFKPEGDVFVLVSGAPDPVSVRIGGTEWLASPVLPPAEIDVFGWEPRAESPRKDEAPYPGTPSSYPLSDPLPSGFDNRFYNGYRRNARATALSRLPYLSAGDEVVIERHGGSLYSFGLGDEAISARYYFYDGKGPDKENRWRQVNVAEVHLDTLVVEPDEDRCYATWRAVWNYDERPADTYRRLLVEAS